MRALGDKPARSFTTAHIDALLRTVADTGVSARAVNKTRNIVAAAFNFGIRKSEYALDSNPALAADVRRERHPGVLLYYSSDEVETTASALGSGLRRQQSMRSADQVAVDEQDAELIRVAAYTGLRLGELLALRWRDVDFAGSVLTVSRAMSAGVETTTKSGRVRRVPLPAQASAALERLTRRADFTAETEFVFVDPTLGRSLNPVTVRKRFKQARDAVGARPLRFHDLRHSYGSLLAASGVDLVTIKEMMGHSALSTPGRYLHARPASEQAATFTRVFTPDTNSRRTPRHRTTSRDRAQLTLDPKGELSTAPLPAEFLPALLSRRRSRVRVPSLPLHDMPAIRWVCQSHCVGRRSAQGAE